MKLYLPILLSTFVTSSLAFSTCPRVPMNSIGVQRVPATITSPSTLCMSGDETDDYDDFFADYDPSEYDSFDSNSYGNDDGVSYGGGATAICQLHIFGQFYTSINFKLSYGEKMNFSYEWSKGNATKHIPLL